MASLPILEADKRGASPIARIRSFSENSFAAAWAEERAMTWEQAAAYALADCVAREEDIP